MLNGLVYKLLYRHISVWQMAGFTLANLCGMTIVVAAIQFAADVLPLFSGNDSFMRPGQIVITKRVNYFSSLSGSTPVFSGEEIKDIKEQSFTKSVGLFLPSQYKVYATIGSKDMGMEFSTQMFFESLPDEFIDVNLNQWKYTAGSDSVPIILPRNYLNLYNFGYATSQGLPTISEGIIKQIGIRLQRPGIGCASWKGCGILPYAEHDSCSTDLHAGIQQDTFSRTDTTTIKTCCYSNEYR